MIVHSAYMQLETIANIKDKDARRTALREACHKLKTLAMAIQYTFHPDIEWDLPETIPAHLIKRSTHDDNSTFFRYVKKLKMFFATSPYSRDVKTVQFAGLLSDVTSKDADLLLTMKNKKLPFKQLNKSFVVKALPELFPAAMVNEVLRTPDTEE